MASLPFRRLFSERGLKPIRHEVVLNARPSAIGNRAYHSRRVKLSNIMKKPNDDMAINMARRTEPPTVPSTLPYPNQLLKRTQPPSTSWSRASSCSTPPKNQKSLLGWGPVGVNECTSRASVKMSMVTVPESVSAIVVESLSSYPCKMIFEPRANTLNRLPCPCFKPSSQAPQSSPL